MHSKTRDTDYCSSVPSGAHIFLTTASPSEASRSANSASMLNLDLPTTVASKRFTLSLDTQHPHSCVSTAHASIKSCANAP